MYCVRPIVAGDLHIYGWESETSVNSAILALPPDAPLLTRLLRLFDEPSAAWPWINEEDRAKLTARQASGEVLTVGDMPWGSTGPLALTECLREDGLIARAAPRHVYYPLLWKDAPLLGVAGVDIASIVRPETRTIHLWHSAVSRRVRQIEQGSPLHRLYTTGTLFEEARLSQSKVAAPGMSPRSILVAASGWNQEAWRAPIRALDPARPVSLWPDVVDPRNVAYALLWRPSAGIFERLTNLQVVFSLGAGVDALVDRNDLPAGIPIVRIVDPDLTQRMTEWVVLQVLMHHRRQRWYDIEQSARRWRIPPQPSAREVRIGIMGMGVFGRSAAGVLVHLGFDVAGWSRTRHEFPHVRSFAGAAELPAFLARTDILVSLLPLTRETRGILSMPLFQRLSRQGKLGPPVIINAGRGELQVEADIVEALEKGILGGASLDVFEREPLDQKSALWGRPNVVITPHVAGASAPAALVPGILRQIAAFERGEPLQNVVDRARGY
jgi:glyoxylate/hydroxypyruvate reductase A